MADIIRKAIQGYQFLFIDLIDKRTGDWLLVAKPYEGLLLLSVYLMFVLKWGPQWMKNRPAFNLDKILLIYNALQVLMCGVVFLKSLYFWGWGGTYRWVCQPVDYTDSEDALAIANLCHMYFLLKVLDLLDTVCFVLRKKFNQISFLHVYHHTGMVILTWMAVTYFPGGHGTYIGVVNSLVHTVMYTYYLFTIAWPNTKNLIWVKKLVTQMQIIQFFLLVVHMCLIVFKSDCQYPRWTAAAFLPQNVFMLILFIDFYIKSYVKKPKVKKSEENITKTNEVDEQFVYKNSDKNDDLMINNENGNFVTSHYNGSEFRKRNVNYNNADQ